MPNLIGTAPNQIPSAGMLGTSAFIDKEFFVPRVSGVLTRQAVQYIDKGTIPSAGTVVLSTLEATVFKITAGGNITITFSDVVAGAFSSDIELRCVNFGGKTITWPAGKWIKPDGSYSTTVSGSGVTWQTSGTDHVLVMFENNEVFYKVMR